MLQNLKKRILHTLHTDYTLHTAHAYTRQHYIAYTDTPHSLPLVLLCPLPCSLVAPAAAWRQPLSQKSKYNTTDDANAARGAPSM
mmetsp:Transcript_25600/g.73920  ORF Transcript_25600/g.73920 Transcript_25600/m.73920 type:complete len:85 (+) Transcript_25600:670-924(+)